MLKQH